MTEEKTNPIGLKMCMMGEGSVGKSAITLKFMYDEVSALHVPAKWAY